MLYDGTKTERDVRSLLAIFADTSRLTVDFAPSVDGLAAYDITAFALAKTIPLASVPTAVSPAMMTATEPATTASASP
jgi:hypothetical protein